MNIIIYTAPQFPACDEAKRFFDGLKLAYREIDVTQDSEDWKELVRRSGQNGVPVIIIDDRVVVGFDRLKLEEALQAR